MVIRRGFARAVVALVALLAVAGCASDGSTMSEGAAVELGEQVRQVRAAATAGAPDDARAGLAAIDSAVERLQASGEISRDDAERITAATTDVDRRLGLLTTSTSNPATTLVPTTAPAPVRTAPPDAPPGQSPTDDEEDEDDEEEDDKDDEDPPKGPKDKAGPGRGRG
jgi:hypothetical protein